MKNKEQRLIENMKMISVELTDKQVSQFIKFYEMLVEWNKVMNLTGITEYDEVVMKHFVDSLSIVKVNGFDNVTSIIDVGTGAGFPGIPLKIEDYREQYDLCVSRAVANLATLSEYCLPYVKVGGCFIPYKSGEIDEELNNSKKAVQILGGKIEEVVKFQLPDTDIGRSFVKIKKNKNTAKKYPRKAGLPAKEPL